MEVEWRDANLLSGWSTWDEVGDHTPATCLTYGRMTHKSRREVKVAQSISEQGHCNSIMAIPTPWIVSIRTLKRGQR